MQMLGVAARNNFLNTMSVRNLQPTCKKKSENNENLAHRQNGNMFMNIYAYRAADDLIFKLINC